jgi:aspartate/methionine/tyrosine aminotransferase
MVFSDECYSEIYRDAPPASMLQAAAATGSFDRVVAFNSLSKRSSLPGLRCGFAAGDPDFLGRWARLRNVCAPQVPAPVQAVASAALRDERHVAANRDLYNAKYRAAEAALAGRFGYATPAGGFFLWLDMATAGGGEAAAIRLWRDFGVRTLPGGYLARPDPTGRNPADNYIRVAMVDDLATTEEALGRIARLAG